MSRVTIMYLWIAFLSGCSTVDMLKTAGKGYMDGEFGMATTALALAPLMLVPDAIDVVSLGAASRPRERSAEPVESSGQTSAMLGSLLQVAGQAAQASGAGQSYESGLLMQGVGAVLAGDDAAAQQAVTSAEQYGANNRALQQQQQAALRQQQYAQQQAAAAAESARRQEWNEQNQRAWELQRQSQQAAQSSSSSITIKGGAPAQGATVIAGSDSVSSLPRVQSSCLTVFDIGDLTAKFKNNCSMPIKVSWCWIPKGASRCTPDRTSDILRPGATSYVSGLFSERNSRTPYVYVCDATRGDYPCK